jgi:hypothetical protein
MALRLRLLGAFIVACGLAVCYGAVVLWPAGMFGSPLGSSLSTGGVLSLAGAGIAAVLGAGNVIAGLAVVFCRPAGE